MRGKIITPKSPHKEVFALNKEQKLITRIAVAPVFGGLTLIGDIRGSIVKQPNYDKPISYSIEEASTAFNFTISL